MRLNMIYNKATVRDIKELANLRIAYLEEDNGEMDKDVLLSIKTNLPDYFIKHLNDDITVYTARDERGIIACAMLLVIEKPMSPAFVTGEIGTVLNVYTRPNHRHKGYARHLMEMLLNDANKKNLSYIELKATEDGYNLYKTLGFNDEVPKYYMMKWYNKK